MLPNGWGEHVYQEYSLKNCQHRWGAHDPIYTFPTLERVSGNETIQITDVSFRLKPTACLPNKEKEPRYGSS